MKAQTAALSAALKGRPKQSTIRITPHVEYPILGDDDNDVEQFFERFDEICALANDGTGMTAPERLVLLVNCLRGARQQTYRVIHNAAKRDDTTARDPEGVFAHIKSRLLRFVETDYEKQTRVLLDYQQCQRGTKTAPALPFQPVWETLLYEMDRVGLGRSPRELFLHYLHCVGTVRETL